jgi:hypothetical protein
MRDYAAVLPIYLEADLARQGWDGAMSPYPGMSLKQFAMTSLRRALMKKFTDAPSSEADAAALTLFLSINEKCRGQFPDPSKMSTIHSIAIGEAKDFIYRLFFPDEQVSGNLRRLTLAEVTTRFGVGDGANLGSFSTDFLSKFGTSTMAATDSVLHILYKQAIRSLPLWSDVESIRSSFRSEAVVRGSRLSFVPKTTEISRTICTEPLLNMIFQKGIASVLEELLFEKCGISLSQQPDKNRQLARLGSMNERFGTIDLSSASDSMSLSLVQSMFPKHVFDMLKMCRCAFTTLPGGSEIELHMISSMGNAFTFPLQTILFSALVYGVYRSLGIHFERPFGRSLGNFAVFGDDIICVSEAYDLLTQVLSICGFSVNIDKSFNTGLFRESCGHDYYYGRNVRGIYLKSFLTSCDIYSAINRLNRWSAIWGIPLTLTIEYLVRSVRFLPIPMDEMDDCGIKVPLRMLKRKRYNRYTGGIQYRFVYRRPNSFLVTDVEARPPKIRGWINNPPAVLMAAVAGSLRAGNVTIRSNERNRASLRIRYSSSWDYISSDYAEMRRVGDGWKSVFELNLTF